jgi:putative tricarboxylic transport membrane protein
MEKFSLRQGDVISGVVLAGLGLYIVLQAHAWNYYGPDGPGPGFFPTWYGFAMIALSVGLIAKSILRSETKKVAAADRMGTVRAVATWAAFAACVALMNVAGFFVSFFLFTIFIVMFVFRRSLLAAGVTAAGTAIAFYITFSVLLGVELPTGFLGF